MGYGTQRMGAVYSEWMITTEDEHIDNAVALAADLERLVQIRGWLRSELESSRSF